MFGTLTLEFSVMVLSRKDLRDYSRNRIGGSQ